VWPRVWSVGLQTTDIDLGLEVGGVLQVQVDLGLEVVHGGGLLKAEVGL